MSVDKFGRNSSGQIYTEPGVSVRYVNNNFIRRDDSNEVEGDLSMNTHNITNLAEPINIRDAVNKRYVDRRKPVITIWAQENGPLGVSYYEWAFGSGDTFQVGGYCMPAPGRIIRGSISSTDRNSTRIYTTSSGTPPRQGAVDINIVISGQVTSNSITKPNDTYYNTNTYNPPIEVAQGSTINFRTNSNSTLTCHIAALLIELDI